MKKVMLKDLKLGDRLELYKNGDPRRVYEVTLLEFFPNGKQVSGLHLTANDGSKRIFSHLNAELEVTLYSGEEGMDISRICSHCGSVMK